MASLDPHDLPEAALTFLRERHLATLTTLRRDGSPHVVPVGFSYDVSTAHVRVITFAASVKAHNAARRGRAVVSQVDGGRWLSLEGVARLTTDPVEVQAAIDGYTTRYRQPGERDDRVAIIIEVDRILGRA
jgi:PPOX class probable F420-dependent enzyme